MYSTCTYAMAHQKRSASTLPPIAELISGAKKHKSSVKQIQELTEKLAQVELDEVPMEYVGNLSQGQVITWLFCKYGVDAVVSVCRALNAVPGEVTEAQRLKFVKEQYVGDESEVAGLTKFVIQACPGVIDVLTMKDSPLILAPPVSCCFDCEQRLVSHHTCAVRCFATTGLKVGRKVTLRCKDCRLIYGYSQFGNKGDLGFRFYPVEREYVEASDTSLFHRNLVELQCCLA